MARTGRGSANQNKASSVTRTVPGWLWLLAASAGVVAIVHFLGRGRWDVAVLTVCVPFLGRMTMALLLTPSHEAVERAMRAAERGALRAMRGWAFLGAALASAGMALYAIAAFVLMQRIVGEVTSVGWLLAGSCVCASPALYMAHEAGAGAGGSRLAAVESTLASAAMVGGAFLGLSPAAAALLALAAFAAGAVAKGIYACSAMQDSFRGSGRKSVYEVLQAGHCFRNPAELRETLSALCEDGVDVDALPNGYGEFGLTPTNPIPTRAASGTAAYLARLRFRDGSRIVSRRVGSVGSDVSPFPVDAYAISLADGTRLATLYLSPYQKRVSRRVPRNFSRAWTSAERPPRRRPGVEDAVAYPITCGTKREVSCVISEASSRTPRPQGRSATTQLPTSG